MVGTASLSSLTRGSPERVADVSALAAMQFLGALAVGDKAFRSQEHHQHEDHTEEEEVVLRDVRLAQQRAPEGAADSVYPLVYLRQEVEVQALKDDGSEDHTVDVPHAPEDDHTEDDDRDVERERVREDVLYERAVEGASTATEDGPEGVGPELGRHRVDAHGRRRRLVFAHRDPGPSKLGVP